MNDAVTSVAGWRKITVSPKVDNQHSAFNNRIIGKDRTAPFLSIKKEFKPKESAFSSKWYDLCYKTGLLNTGLQLLSGVALTALAIFGKKRTDKPFKTLEGENIQDLYKGVSHKIAAAASFILGAGYFIGGPSVLGAGIKSEQPGTLLSGTIWMAASPFMMRGLNPRINGILAAGYAPTFVGFANEITNRYRKEGNETDRKMNMDFLLEKQTYKNCFSLGDKGADARKKMFDILSFCIKDQIKSVKTTAETLKESAEQGAQFFKGERTELPDIISTKPSKESMCLGSLLVLAGALPKILLGAKLGGKTMKFADITIGAGFLFESIGMISLANQKDDSRRAAVLAGGPLRIAGDFAHENPLMYGIRTIGGASFEYYYTLMNKETDGSVKDDHEPFFIQKMPAFIKNPSSILLKKQED